MSGEGSRPAAGQLGITGPPEGARHRATGRGAVHHPPPIQHPPRAWPRRGCALPMRRGFRGCGPRHTPTQLPRAQGTAVRRAYWSALMYGRPSSLCSQHPLIVDGGTCRAAVQERGKVRTRNAEHGHCYQCRGPWITHGVPFKARSAPVAIMSVFGRKAGNRPGLYIPAWCSYSQSRTGVFLSKSYASPRQKGR
jgi:hypothetical protein